MAYAAESVDGPAAAPVPPPPGPPLGGGGGPGAAEGGIGGGGGGGGLAVGGGSAPAAGFGNECSEVESVGGCAVQPMKATAMQAIRSPLIRMWSPRIAAPEFCHSVV